MAMMIPSRERVNHGARKEPGIRLPITTLATTPMTPMMLASAIFPGRIRYIQSPTNSAIGIVMAIVNVPHGLSRKAFTTVNPSPAMAISMMMRMAIDPTIPARGLISFRAISASERPLRRMEATSTVKSCTAPATTTPITSQRKPGRNPNWAARTGPMSGPAPEIAAKWCPKRTHLFVGS